MLYFCKDPEIHPILQSQLVGLKPKKAGVFQASWCYKPEGAQAGRLVGCTLTGLLAKKRVTYYAFDNTQKYLKFSKLSSLD